MVSEEEVGETAAGDGERVREDDRCVKGVYEHAHENEVAEKRDETVGEMEAEELYERLVGVAL